MNSTDYFRFCQLLCVATVFLGGCVFKPVGTLPRQFVLTPIPASQQTAAKDDPLLVGVRSVKMAPYLLKTSIAMRKGNNEIEYLEDAAWAERLNQGFQRTLAADLVALLPTARVYLSAWGRDQVKAIVVVTVEEFDVDIQGRGTLVADWQVLGPDSEKPFMSGQARLNRTGVSPRGKPEAAVSTMSLLVGDFSRELAQALGHCTPR